MTDADFSSEEIGRNINFFLLTQISPHLGEYNLDKAEIEKILILKKRYNFNLNEGVALIKKIMDPHKKKNLDQFLANLAYLEPPYRNIKKTHRDHVIHALQTYILGIYLNEFFLSKFHARVNVFQWKIACLFHDIGYPIEMGQFIMNSYSTKGNSIRDDAISRYSKLSFNITPKGFNELTEGKTGLSLIQKCINKWNLNIDARDEFTRMLSTEKIQHGAITALTILNIIDLLYYKYETWDRSSFYDNIVPACSAIFIHDLPWKSFEFKKINRESAPIAFLLRLADNLQEWQRPSFKQDLGFSPRDFKIVLNDQSLQLISTIKKERVNEINLEIEKSLESDDIRIEWKSKRNFDLLFI